MSIHIFGSVLVLHFFVNRNPTKDISVKRFPGIFTEYEMYGNVLLMSKYPVDKSNRESDTRVLDFYSRNIKGL